MEGKVNVKVPTVGTLGELGKVLANLSQEQKNDELRRRATLLESIKALKAADSGALDRAEKVGQEIGLYREALKGQRNFGKILREHGLVKSTVYRCQTAWKVSQISGMRTAAEGQGINLIEARSSTLANRILKEHKTVKGAKMPPAELLAFCQKAMADENKAGEAPTVAKESGPMPDDDDNSVVVTGKTAEVLVRFRARFKDADALIEEWMEQILHGGE